MQKENVAVQFPVPGQERRGECDVILTLHKLFFGINNVHVR